MLPITLQVKDRACLIVGGGKVGYQKWLALKKSGALVTIISPVIDNVFEHDLNNSWFNWIKREFSANDTTNFFLIIAATNSLTINKLIYEEAISNNKLINVVDVPELCNFYFPSILRRGKLSIAVSTEGAAPALAKKIREDLELSFPQNYSKLLELLEEKRESLKKGNLSLIERNELLKKIINSPEITEFLNGK